MKVDFLIILVQRMKSENPVFFKKLQFYCIVFGIVVAFFYGILFIDLFCIEPILLDKLKQVCYAIETFLCGIIFTSTATTTDPNLVSPDLKENIKNQIENETEN
jgi:hypothetical protein